MNEQAEDNGNTLSPTADGAVSVPSDFMYPTVFYCPITKQLLKDPVVLADGISYERSAIEARNNDEHSSTEMYGNRALKSVVEDSTRSALQKIQDKARQFITAENRPLSGGFYCPITLALMHVPVIDPQGYTYEKVAIESWIMANGDSPVTRETLSISDLLPNKAIADLLHAEANRKDDVIHPALQKWKTESPPTMSSIELAPTSSSLEAGEGDQPLGTASPPVLFPRTREQYAAQLAQNAREQRIRMMYRYLSILVLCLLMVGSFFVPYLAAILLVVVIFGICVVTHESTRF